MAYRFDHPSLPVDPYPAQWEDVGPAAPLDSDETLVLLRTPAMVLDRAGAEDGSYIVARPYTIVVEVDAAPWPITVPQGMITDLTSVPRPLRWVAGRVGPWLEAAIVHDYLYIAWQDFGDRAPQGRDRQFADLVMLEMMDWARVGVLRWLIFAAVRAFGGASFRRRIEDRYAEVPPIGPGFALPRG
ncbi:DUF1353 domain-containing protein [Hasllibacter sp. MH4015]|uniref:DUF1353 domain-containing protein n=1 Tax=Hasllibacter sp. MH4015 TaxID=2854029 RepID=UPI001CD804DC|nr:DUF1353 domain-containing protein [Hasllibacter sp. MH4015]